VDQMWITHWRWLLTVSSLSLLIGNPTKTGINRYYLHSCHRTGKTLRDAFLLDDIAARQLLVCLLCGLHLNSCVVDEARAQPRNMLSIFKAFSNKQHKETQRKILLLRFITQESFYLSINSKLPSDK